MRSPAWVWLVTAVIFGCSAYLTLQFAALVYGKYEPLPDGPRPTSLRAGIPVALAAFFGGYLAFRGIPLAKLAVADVIACALSAATWTDMTRGFVGDWFTLPPLALVLLIALLRGDIVPVAVSIAVVGLPFAGGALLSKGRGVGWGDVKLIALGAALLDLQTSILVFAVTCFVVSGVGVLRGRRNEPIAFAPYLSGAIACALLLPVARPIG